MATSEVIQTNSDCASTASTAAAGAAAAAGQIAVDGAENEHCE